MTVKVPANVPTYTLEAEEPEPSDEDIRATLPAYPPEDPPATADPAPEGADPPAEPEE